jgi:E3 ubiquitin-protein ligase MARCH6
LEVFLQPVLRVLGFVEVPSEEIVTFASEAVPVPSFLSETLSTFIDLVEPYFAPLGRGLREDYVKFGKLWIGLATNDGPVERIFSVVFGYCILASIIALYLNILTVGNAKTAGRAVRKAVEQQLLVFKVATFIFIELVTFPLGCGVILDMCTLWLFPNSSYTSRMEFFYQAPLTSTFYHWVSGTMFMYSFAVLLSGCRSIMRPGAMWFIKDPQDQNAHPIRDILERNTLVQFRKILISGVMYSFIVAGAVGTVAALLFLGQQFVLPFRWKTREPLSNVPIDLLFLNLALPYTMTYFRPRKAIRKFTIVVWKELSRRLRLSSYFFGKRYGEEEYTPKTWSLGRTIYGPTKDADVVAADYDGSFRRVPNTDDIALPREMRATVAVTAAGDPVDEAASKLMTEQNEVTTKVNRNVKQDFIVVYIPPYFRYRMILFVSMLWSVGALCAGISLVLPVLLGRGFFGIIFKGKREVHDGYSILAGFYMLWACWIAGKAVDRLDKRRQRWGSEGPRASLWWLAVKRGLLWFVKASYMAIFLGVVIPTLVGCVVELYVTLPFKLHLSQDIGVPRIRVLDCWATGLLYTKIVIRVIRRQGHGQNPISRGLQVIKRNGWTHPDPITATKDVIGPVAGGLTGMILLPALIFYAIHFFFPLVGRYVEDKFLFAYVYSGLFCLAGLIHTFSVLREMLASWSQSVRDKEFLVEMRLRNHDPMPPSGTPTPVSTNAIPNQLAG